MPSGYRDDQIGCTDTAEEGTRLPTSISLAVTQKSLVSGSQALVEFLGHIVMIIGMTNFVYSSYHVKLPSGSLKEFTSIRELDFAEPLNTFVLLMLQLSGRKLGFPKGSSHGLVSNLIEGRTGFA